MELGAQLPASAAPRVWDYVIVGGGSAGCVLANRLSADPKVRVLLVEAGDWDFHPYLQVPAALIRTIGNPRYDWCHRAEPDASRRGRVDLWPGGRVLGGSSAINGMLFVRGHPADFDAWTAAGNYGWSFEEVLPYFRRLESTLFGEDSVRGRDGPIAVSGLRSTHPLARVFQAAMQQQGVPANADYNGRDNEGIAEPQVTQRNGRRFSASRGYLWPIRRRPNLEIATRTRCERLLFEDRRCVGAEFQGETGRWSARARGEVIVAAGALQSPKLLLLSGIGPGAELSALGIRPVVDSPAVGRNLLDHPTAMVSADVNVRTYNVEINSGRVAWHALRWLLFRTGPATSPYPHAVAFLRSDPSRLRPDLQVMFGPYSFSFSEAGIVPYLAPAVSATINPTHPRNPGRVRLRSARSEDALRIEHELLASDEDIAELIAGCRRMRDVFASAAFKPYVLRERLPGPDVVTDADWTDYLRRTAFLGYHPVGTCRMGTDPETSVVTPVLEVRGVGGLRVVDASVMPTLISANTNAATLMIAEKAADLILGARGV
jgi:choline dehydrogenase